MVSGRVSTEMSSSSTLRITENAHRVNSQMMMKDVIIIGVNQATEEFYQKALKPAVDSFLVIQAHRQLLVKSIEVNFETVTQIKQDFEWGFNVHTAENNIYHSKSVILTANSPVNLSEQLKLMKIEFTRRNSTGHEDSAEKIPGLFTSYFLQQDKDELKKFLDYNLDLNERIKMKESYIAIKRGSQIF